MKLWMLTTMQRTVLAFVAVIYLYLLIGASMAIGENKCLPGFTGCAVSTEVR